MSNGEETHSHGLAEIKHSHGPARHSHDPTEIRHSHDPTEKDIVTTSKRDTQSWPTRRETVMASKGGTKQSRSLLSEDHR